MKPGKTTLPEGLNEARLDLWRDLAGDYTGRMTRRDALLLRHLVDAARRLDEVRATLDAEGPTVAGSKGQPRPNPLIQAETALRLELDTRVLEWTLRFAPYSDDDYDDD